MQPKYDRGEIRRLLVLHEGKVKVAALAMGMSPAYLSQILNRGPMHFWWRRWITRFRREKRNRRQRVWRATKRRRELAAMGLDPNLYTPRRPL